MVIENIKLDYFLLVIYFLVVLYYSIGKEFNMENKIVYVYGYLEKEWFKFIKDLFVEVKI